MKKVFKWIGIVLGSLVGLMLVLAATLFFMTSARLNKTYDFPPSGIVVPTDQASIEYGKRRVNATCIGCHGADLSGLDDWIVVGPLVTIDSANLTPGAGGIGSTFSDEDYVRAIRHGIGQDGKPIYMPAVLAFQHLSDEDLGAMIAYLKTIPPVDRKTNGHQFTVLGKIVFATGAFGKLPVEEARHEMSIVAPPAGVTTEYGEYLVNISGCRDCHGAELAGGSFPDPNVVFTVPNITPGGESGAWTEEEFLATIRMGITPSGRGINSNLMPLDEVNNLTDDELKAVWMYLQSLPALEQVVPK